MSWFVFKQFSLLEDLSDLHQLLNKHQVPHRFTEEGGHQKLWLADQNDVQVVQDIIFSLENNPEIAREVSQGNRLPGINVNVLQGLILGAPSTAIIVLCACVVYLLAGIEFSFVRQNLSFIPEGIRQGEIWRLVSPAFIHFGVLHILFNALWVWEFGRRLEKVMGKLPYLLLFLLSAVVANVAQFLFGGNLNFGGLSGVVYGYLGCLFVLYRWRPVAELYMPPGILIFMLIWLGAGFIGAIDFFIAGKIANWAHLGGLLSGCAYAYGFMKLSRG